MLTEKQAIVMISDVCKRHKCVLTNYTFNGGALTIYVKGSQGRTQIGKEYDWQNYTEQQLGKRVANFCQHWVNKTPYCFEWKNKL